MSKRQARIGGGILRGVLGGLVGVVCIINVPLRFCCFLVGLMLRKKEIRVRTFQWGRQVG
jgi:hypothetical protein